MSSDSGDRYSAFASESVPDEYERHLVPTVFGPWAEVLLDAVVVAPGTQVLDYFPGREAAVGEMWRVLRPGWGRGDCRVGYRASARAIRCLR